MNINFYQMKMKLKINIKIIKILIGKNSKKINYIRIDLDRGKDLYNMEFIRMARKKGELSPTLKVVKKIKGVYADQLRDLFTKYTGMYTSLQEIKNDKTKRVRT